MKAGFAARDNNLVTKVTESVASSGKLYRLPPNKEKTVDLARAKGRVPVNKFIIYFKRLTHNYCKEIYLDLSLQSVKN